VPDPRNWSGSGNRSITNMFIDLGQGVALTDKQFQDEMDRRKAKLHWTRNDVIIGCPLCNSDPILPKGMKPATPATGTGTGTGDSGASNQ